MEPNPGRTAAYPVKDEDRCGDCGKRLWTPSLTEPLRCPGPCPSRNDMGGWDMTPERWVAVDAVK